MRSDRHLGAANSGIRCSHVFVNGRESERESASLRAIGIGWLPPDPIPYSARLGWMVRYEGYGHKAWRSDDKLSKRLPGGPAELPGDWKAKQVVEWVNDQLAPRQEKEGERTPTAVTTGE